MTIKELFETSWYVGAAVVLGYAVIALLVVSLLYQLLHDHSKRTETFVTRFLDKGTIWLAGFMEDHFIWLNDDEPECPEWADPQRWNDTLSRKRK